MEFQECIICHNKTDTFDLISGICRDCKQDIYEGDEKTLEIYFKTDIINCIQPSLKDQKFILRQYKKSQREV